TKRDPRNTDAPTVDTVRATTPPAYPFPHSHNVKQPGDQSPTQRPAPGKKNHKSQISPAPAAQSIILAMMPQVSNAAHRSSELRTAASREKPLSAAARRYVGPSARGVQRKNEGCQKNVSRGKTHPSAPP